MKFLRHFSPPNIAAYFGLVFFLLVLYWLLWPFKSIDIVSPIPMVKDTYLTGEIADYDVTFCKYLDDPATITRTLVYTETAQRRSYGDLQSTISHSLSCPQTIRAISTNLTSDLPSGKARLELIYRYRCSPLQVCTKRAMTTEFTIINPGEGQ